MENAQKRINSILTHLTQDQPLVIVLLGAPGAGKGTFARLLSNHYKIPPISTGDLVRQEIKLNTPLGQKIKEISASGGYVDDATITSMLKQRLAQDDCRKGYILDGFPRTMSQAAELNKITTISVVLEIYLPFDVILKTTAGRRVCSGCGDGYNITSIDQHGIIMKPLLPRVDNTCDRCASSLIHRDDDKEDIVRERLLIYDSQTRPLLDFYKKYGLLVTHKVQKGKQDWPVIEKLIDNVIIKTLAPKPSTPSEKSNPACD